MAEPEIPAEILVAEYERIQGDIRQHKDTQQTILNFIFVMISIELAGLSQIGRLNAIFVGVVLVVPVPFALLAFYHSAYTMRIHRLAEQFDTGLRDQLESLGAVKLTGYRYTSTRWIWQLLSSTVDGRLTYLALAGLKALPQLIPLALFPAVAA